MRFPHVDRGQHTSFSLDLIIEDVGKMLEETGGFLLCLFYNLLNINIKPPIDKFQHFSSMVLCAVIFG